MLKIILALTITLFGNFIFPLSSFSQTEEETLTITTYYPAPFGVYNEMRAKKMAVGTNYYNGSAYPWDTGGGCTGNEICNADLVVQGNVGIGTTSPGNRLSVVPASTTGYNSGTGAIEAFGTGTKKLLLGYDDTIDAGFIGALDPGVAWKNVIMGINGNVGIGTTDPDYKLSFGPDAGGASNILAFVDEADPNPAMRGIGALSGGGQYGIGFWADLGAAATTTNSRMYISANNGNVGIGTVNAVSHLTVTGGNGDANGFLLLSDSSANPSAGNRRAIYVCGTSLCFNNGANNATLSSVGDWVPASDVSIKKDIQDLSKYGLNTVMLLQPREYKMKSDLTPQIGFIAQEIEKIIPEVVSGEEGSKGLSYGYLTAVLTKAIQEQQREIEELREKLASLEAEK